jgi:RNA polymerase sigma factor (sigma-70 family)
MSNTAKSVIVPIKKNMKTNHLPSDEEVSKADHVAPLIEAVSRKRDRNAFKHIYNEFGPKIKSYAIKQGMLETAEELVQEVMVNIWRRARQFNRSKAGGSTWIFAITRNARIDLLRKLSRSSKETQVETDYLWSLPGTDDPTSSFQQALTARQIRQSLTTLPIEQRDVIAKVYLEDKSHQRVADELELPLGTVKSRVRLALQKLKVIFHKKPV